MSLLTHILTHLRFLQDVAKSNNVACISRAGHSSGLNMRCNYGHIRSSGLKTWPPCTRVNSCHLRDDTIHCERAGEYNVNIAMGANTQAAGQLLDPGQGRARAPVKSS